MSKLKSCGFLIFRENPTSGPTTDQAADTLNGSASEISTSVSSNETNTDRQISFLLLKHSTRWDLPKGHVDPGETNMECAIRELTEETGIQERDLIVDPNFRYKQKYIVNSKRTNGKPRKKKLIIYAAELIHPVELKLTEHEGYEWFDWAPPHAIQEKTIDPLLEEFWLYREKTLAPAVTVAQPVSEPHPTSNDVAAR